MGVPGESSRSAVIARHRPGLLRAWHRRPLPEFATWSWFWMKVTNCHASRSSAGVPRRYSCHAYRCPWNR